MGECQQLRTWTLWATLQGYRMLAKAPRNWEAFTSLWCIMDFFGYRAKIANAFFQMSLLTSQQWSLVKKWLFSFSFLLFFALFGFLFVSTRSISRTMSFFAQTFVWKCHVAFSQKDVNLSNESTACDCTLSSGTHYASLTAKTPNIQNTRHLFTPHVSNLILF